MITGRSSLVDICAGAGRFDAGFPQGIQRFGKAGISPIQDMIVRQRATFNIRRGNAGNIVRIHPVIDGLVLYVVTAGYGGFQIDDAQVRFSQP